jgi:hypothetical protein
VRKTGSRQQVTPRLRSGQAGARDRRKLLCESCAEAVQSVEEFGGGARPYGAMHRATFPSTSIRGS